MAQIFRDGDRLVLAFDDGYADASKRGFDFQLLSPLLLGLLAPFLAVAYFLPGSTQDLKWPIFLFLVLMFLVCTGLFFYTAHFPGKINSIIVDRDARMIEIVWRNLVSTASQIVPFKDISALRVRNDYDEDGYPELKAELVLQLRPPIELPRFTTEDHLRPLRAAIGLG